MFHHSNVFGSCIIHILYIYSTNIGTEYVKHSNVFGSCIIHILYIYSTNIGTEYFKHGIYSPFFSLQKCSLFHNSNVFGSCITHILYTECAKIKKKNNSFAKRLTSVVDGGLLHFPAALPPQRGIPVRWTGPRAGLDFSGEKKLSSVLQPVAYLLY